MSDKFSPTAEEARALRDATGCGLHEAKREIRRDKLQVEVLSIRSSYASIEERFDRLLAVVEALISNE